jgi:molecular chaperone GrpE
MEKKKNNTEEINQEPSTEDKVTEEKNSEKEVTENKDSANKKKGKKNKGSKDRQNDKIMELEEELKSLEDKYLRLYSDFDNFRKRTSKEKIELTKTASAEVIASLLSILDDFDRAKKAMNEADSIEAVCEGIDLIHNKLNDTLKKKGLEEMNCIGEEFNTDFHEAITKIPAESEEMKGKIIDQVEKGYLLNGNVIRYAKVVVGS